MHGHLGTKMKGSDNSKNIWQRLFAKIYIGNYKNSISILSFLPQIC